MQAEIVDKVVEVEEVEIKKIETAEVGVEVEIVELVVIVEDQKEVQIDQINLKKRT